jgi:hypothetical protein
MGCRKALAFPLHVGWEEIRQLTERALATLSTAEREALIRILQQIRRNLSAG